MFSFVFSVFLIVFANLILSRLLLGSFQFISIFKGKFLITTLLFYLFFALCFHLTFFNQVISTDGRRYINELVMVVDYPFGWDLIKGTNSLGYSASPKMGCWWLLGFILSPIYTISGEKIRTIALIIAFANIFTYFNATIIASTLLARAFNSSYIFKSTQFFLLFSPVSLFWSARVTRETSVSIILLILTSIVINTSFVRIRAHDLLIRILLMILFSFILFTTRSQAFALFIPILLFSPFLSKPGIEDYFNPSNLLKLKIHSYFPLFLIILFLIPSLLNYVLSTWSSISSKFWINTYLPKLYMHISEIDINRIFPTASSWGPLSFIISIYLAFIIYIVMFCICFFLLQSFSNNRFTRYSQINHKSSKLLFVATFFALYFVLGVLFFLILPDGGFRLLTPLFTFLILPASLSFLPFTKFLQST